MSDDATNSNTETVQTTNTNVVAVVPAAPKADPKPGEPEWLPARLQSEREREQRRIAAELGIDLSTAKEKLAALKKLEDEQKSDQERAAEKLAELDRVKARNIKLEEAITFRAHAEMSALDASKQEAVKRIAGEDPASQLTAIDALKPTWVVAVPAALPATPTTTAPPPNSMPAPGYTGVASQNVNHRETYLALKRENPIKAADYAQLYPEAYKVST